MLLEAHLFLELPHPQSKYYKGAGDWNWVLGYVILQPRGVFLNIRRLLYILEPLVSHTPYTLPKGQILRAPWYLKPRICSTTGL